MCAASAKSLALQNAANQAATLPGMHHLSKCTRARRGLSFACASTAKTPCVDACIGESLKCGNEGIIIQDEKRCIGCFMCNMVCPHGAIKTVMSLEKAFKCTLICGEKDNPPCVAVCDREALFFDDFNTTVKKRRNRKIRGLIKR